MSMKMLESLSSKVTKTVRKPMVRGMLWMVLARGSRIFLQAAYFVIVARTLGVSDYGIFMGVASLVAIASPFSSWGSAQILVQNVARNRALFNEYWGNSLFMTLTSGSLLLLLVMLTAHLILPSSVSPYLVFLIGLSDLIFLRIIDTAGKAFLSVEMFHKSAKVNISLSLKNLAAAIMLVFFFKHPGVIAWGFVYMLSTAISALVAIADVCRSIGMPTLALWRIKSEMRQGFYFSIGLSSQTIYNDIDKTMLASLSTMQATGIYSAAYRVINVAFIPVIALLAAAYARFFKKGEKGIAGSLQVAKQLMPPMALYGAAIGVCLFLSAPLIPYILGNDYTNAIDAVRWLAPLPFLKSIHYFAGDTLTGAGLQGFRSATQVIVAGVNCVLNLWLIPLFSWEGAAWSSLASDSLLAVGLWGIIAYYYRRQWQTKI